MFNKITNLENLFLAWTGFKKGKSSKPEVMQFEKSLEQNIFNLHRELMDGTYKHAPYEGFFITDPKLRHVHKASIRDRILHHAMFKILNPKFEPCFISTSFSCQIGKGSHRGMRMVARMLRKVSKNNTLPCYALKCDVRKFFDSIDHEILLSILKKRVRDQKTIDLLKEVIGSFEKSGIRERERFVPNRRTYWKFDFPTFRQCLYE